MTDLMIDAILFAALRAFSAAMAAGADLPALLRLWERVAGLLPPTPAEAVPPAWPAGMPAGAEFVKSLRRYRRAAGLFAALTSPQYLRKCGAGLLIARAALKFATRDLRHLTTVRAISASRRFAASAAPANPLRVATQQATNWPPPTSDPALRARAQTDVDMWWQRRDIVLADLIVPRTLPNATSPRSVSCRPINGPPVPAVHLFSLLPFVRLQP